MSTAIFISTAVVVNDVSVAAVFVAAALAFLLSYALLNQIALSLQKDQFTSSISLNSLTNLYKYVTVSLSLVFSLSLYRGLFFLVVSLSLSHL